MATILLLISIVILDIFIYRHLFFYKKEKELAFIEGSAVSVENFITSDLKLIFNPSANLNQLSILKSYSHISRIKQDTYIVGSVLYVKVKLYNRCVN